MEESQSSNSLASLTDDLLVEILRRVPVRSLCRFKCVSRSWRNLISDPAHRKKLPHTLVGFVYESCNEERCPSTAHHFTNVTGRDAPFIVPDFSIFHTPRDEVLVEDSCNGLLLCSCFEPGPYEGDADRPFHYIVCNPATKKWVMLPDGSGERRIVRLGFDPGVSSHFHVVEYVMDDTDCIIGVEIYSSKTGAWSFKESELGDYVMLVHYERSVFLNGFMHMPTSSHGIMVVDMEGKTWRLIPLPADIDFGCIHLSQGRLCFLYDDKAYASKLWIWTLEDHGTHEWTFKHSVRKLFLFGNLHYTAIAFHPECNLIYFVYGRDNTLMAYEMDHKEVCVIRNLGDESMGPFLPYVPLFSEALADER